jgi:hypothetical protein
LIACSQPAFGGVSFADAGRYEKLPDVDNVQQAAFSTDGETVVTVSPHRVKIWNFGSPGSIIAHYRGSIGEPPAETGESGK